MVELVIGCTAALRCIALGLAVFVLRQPDRAAVMLVESDVRGILP